jgi:hypothetical protein
MKHSDEQKDALVELIRDEQRVRPYPEELTPAQEREYVESKWEYDFLCLRSGSGNLPWHSWIGVVNKPDNWDGYFATEAEAIHAAFLFTQELEEQIRQLENQIAWLDSLVEWAKDISWAGCKARAERELEKLKRGMK